MEWTKVVIVKIWMDQRRRQPSRRDVCKHCQKDVRERDNALQCDHCSLWIHAKCEKISDGLYQDLEKEEEQEWFCRECKTLMMRSVEEKLKLRKVNDEMKKDNDEIRQELSGLKTQSEVALVQMKRYEEKEEGGENNQIEKGRTLRRTGKELIIMWKRCR